MARYRVQGPSGEIIEIEGPDGANPADVIAQAQTLYRPQEKTATDYAKDFGKATASLADVGLNAITGALDYAAYPLARAFGRTPEQATAETTSPKDVIGRAFGITQDPAYQSEISRRAMGAVGQGMQAVAKPISATTGLPESDVENMLGSAAMFAGAKAQPYVNRARQAVGQAVYAAEPLIAEAAKAPVKYPYQFARGFSEGIINKEHRPGQSAMAALQDTYIPPAAAQRFMGEMPGVPQQTLAQLQSQARPTSELVDTTAGRIAQAVSPTNAAGQTLVPLQGQGMQAFGERVGRGVRTSPLQALGEIGVTALTGIPFKTLAQGAGELGARYLGAKTGFAPGFESQLGAAQAQAALQPTTPRLAYTPTAPGPVAPSTIYAGGGGASADLAAAGQAALNAKYPSMPTTPQQAVQQAAAARVQGMPPVADLQTRAQAAFGSQYRPPATQQLPSPVTTAPVAPAPVVETPVITAPVVSEPIATAPAPVVKSTMTPTTQYGKVPVTGEEYYKHYIAGGKTPSELKYAPGTLAEELYNKVKKDPASLTRQDIENWYAYDQSMISMPDLNATKATKKSPGITEQQKIEQASKQLAKRLVQDYERVQAQTSYGRPEIKGMTVEEARALDQKKMQDLQDKIAKQNLEEDIQRKAAWDAMTDKEKQKFLKTGGRNPYELPEWEGGTESTASTSKKAPPGVSQMIVPEQPVTPVVHENKAAFDKANLFNTLANRSATGSYREGNKIITVYPYQGEWPWPPDRPAPTTTQAVDAVTGERVPVGKTWNPAIGDTEPVSSKVRAKLNKNK